MSRAVVPAGAIRVGFNYGKSKGYFHIGQSSNGKWWWDALGNNGEEDTANRAIEASRLWIVESRVRRSVNFTQGDC